MKARAAPFLLPKKIKHAKNRDMEKKGLCKFFIKITVYIILVHLGLSLFSFYRIIRPAPFLSETTPENYNLNYEEVSFLTSDGLKLSGWFLPSKNNEADLTVVLLHGYPADKGNIVHRAKELIDHFHVFLFDFRYLGESEGKFSTLGIRERRDLHAALDFLEKEKNIERVALWGYSMGGAVAIMVTPDRDIVRGVVTEAAYADMYQMAREAYNMPLFDRSLAACTLFWGGVFFRINPARISPKEIAPQLDVPILLLHFQKDPVVPFDHALKLKEVLSDNLWLETYFPDRDTHGSLTNKDYDRIRKFLLTL